MKFVNRHGQNLTIRFPRLNWLFVAFRSLRGPGYGLPPPLKSLPSRAR